MSMRTAQEDNTVWNSSQRQCQNVALYINDMSVIDHKEKVSLINHKIVCD